MPEVKQMQEGDFGIFTIHKGEIRQIGLTESESQIIRAILGGMSIEKKLLLLPEEYTLILKNQNENGNRNQQTEEKI